MIRIVYNAIGKTPQDAAANAQAFFAALPEDLRRLASGPKPALPTGGEIEQKFIETYGAFSMRQSAIDRLGLTGTREEMYQQLFDGMESGAFYRYKGNNMIMPKGEQPGGNARKGAALAGLPQGLPDDKGGEVY